MGHVVMRMGLVMGLLMGGLLACSDDAGPGEPTDAGPDAVVDAGGEVEGVPGIQVSMDFTRAGGFFSAPFPDESRRSADGIDLSDFPNPSNVAFVRDVLRVLDASVDGFGVSSGIFFSLDGPPSTELPSVEETVGEGSPVFLISIDPGSSDYGRRYPVSVFFEADGGPFGAANLLSLLPVNGIPLREGTGYAGVILRGLGDAQGEPLGVPVALAELLADERPLGLSESAFESYRAALASLSDLGVEVSELAGLAVFVTDVPTAELFEAHAQLAATSVPVPNEVLALTDTFDDYCVYEGTIDMPDLQSGEPPYGESGGAWERDTEGAFIIQRQAESRMVVTLPRAPMPEDGFPVMAFVRTGGGGDRPLVDRGVHAVEFGEAVEPGTGPAIHFARAGFAGASIDGPLGGLRNPAGSDEQFLIFNVNNPFALRDNVRQSALEVALVAEILQGLTIDASDCEGLSVSGGGSDVGFDLGRAGVMGHSTGSTIADLAAAVQPRYGAVVLSGAGGSYIENILYKQRPIEVRPVANLILGYDGTTRSVHAHDPVLSLLQWAGEPADPPPYNRWVIDEPIVGEPRRVLMLQGIVDTYLLPPIANGMSLSLGLDLAGAALDAEEPRLAAYTPLDELLPFVGREVIALPVEGNRVIADTDVTAVVVQHEEDGIEDGHEVVFQTEAPKHQYRCFLESYSSGTPRVPVAGGELDPCE